MNVRELCRLLSETLHVVVVTLAKAVMLDIEAQRKQRREAAR